MSVMTPREIVHELNKHIVGQEAAKRSVAIALRNRWRRMQLPEELRNEVTPKNILMIGPTGVGKTEIARRLARLAQAPFIKIEATKFTEVGYVGRDVESIIRDLADHSVKMLREIEIERVRDRARDAAEERVLDAMLPTSGAAKPAGPAGLLSALGLSPDASKGQSAESADDDGDRREQPAVRQSLRKMLREGKLDDKDLEIEVAPVRAGFEIVGPPGMEEVGNHISKLLSMSNSQRKKAKMTVRNALKRLEDEEAASLVDEDELQARAVEAVEQSGIVFLDEIDKVARGSRYGADVSREGVQRDLLPLIEGSSISTKYGIIRTDHILFIASGAFHLSKPSDLIPELQGRLPIRVELDALTPGDFKRILIEPDASLTEQYRALLAVDGTEIEFTDDALNAIAELAFQVNENTENIGARRLHTILERLLEDISFRAGETAPEIKIDVDYVNEHLLDLVKDQDLSKFIL